jgi:hypothetical protein
MIGDTFKSMVTDTELRLSFWRRGSTDSERLAASVLRLSGYEEIDPQSPLGGPDGKKDILCQKGGLVWIGAVYFPNGPTRFTAIKKKFTADLTEAPTEPRGFAFITNQTLTPAQRKALKDVAQAAGKEVDILHLQQLINLLDSPPGYGVRLQHLHIPMTIEEQLSWSVDSDSQTAKALSTPYARAAGIACLNRTYKDRSITLDPHIGACCNGRFGDAGFDLCFLVSKDGQFATSFCSDEPGLSAPFSSTHMF